MPKIKMTKKASSSKVIWALDPMEKDTRAVQKMTTLLTRWSGNQKVIVPVTVLSPLDLGWPMPISPKLEKELLFRAKEKLTSLLDGLVPVAAAKILISKHLSLLSSVEKLLAFATKEKPEIIAVYTRSNPDSDSRGLGSFAEMAISTSKLPVLVASNETEIPGGFKKILFPSDFSDSRQKAFEKAIQLAKRHDAELVIYHHAGTPLAPMTFTSFGAPLEAAWLQSAYETNQAYEKKMGDRLVAQARKKGIRCRLISDFTPATWSQRLLDINKKEKADLFIISVRRGVWGQAFFGGKIRKLFAESKCPMLLIHKS